MVARRRQGVAGDLERGHRVDGEAAQTASGDGVQRRPGCSGGRRRARRGPAAPVQEGEAGVSSNLGVARLGGRSPKRGKTAAALGQSPARRRGSGGGKPAMWTHGRWERRCDAQAWMGETNGARGENSSAGGRWLRFNGKQRGGGLGGVDAT
jgi:hypothetical protein